MPISWSAERREFHLHNDRISYLMRVHDNGALGHLHVGGPLAADRSAALPGSGGLRRFLESRRRAGRPGIPDDGLGDHRIPAVTVELADGSTVLDLAYVEHRIVPGKPDRAAAGRLPATYVESDDEADTLDDRPGRRARAA